MFFKTYFLIVVIISESYCCQRALPRHPTQININTFEEDKIQHRIPINPNKVCPYEIDQSVEYCWNNGKCLSKVFIINQTHYDRSLYCECPKVNSYFYQNLFISNIFQ